MQQVSLEWFESVCVELTRNPVAATKTIESFRDSDLVVNACRSFLLDNNATYLAKFQAVSVLQISYLSRWKYFQKHDHVEMKQTVFSIVSSIAALQNQPNRPPAYLTNKLIQVLVSFWKHDWLDCDDHEKESFYQNVAQYLTSPNHMRIGTILLESMLEEFATKSFAESNLSFERHMEIKKVFQSKDLQRVFILAVQSISTVFQSLVTAGNNISTHFNILSELLKLLIEIISWDFSSSASTAVTKQGGEGDGAETNRRGIQQYNKLPREWAAYLIQPSFIDSVYGMYSQLIQLDAQKHEDDVDSELENCILETRNLILCLSSINGEIFASTAEQIALASCIVEYSVKMVDNSSGHTQSGSTLTLTCDSYEEGGSRYRDLELFLSIMYRLLTNFKVPILSQMSNFTSMLLAMSKLAQENAVDLLTISKDMMNRITAITTQQQGPNNALYEQQLRCAYDTHILDTWRGDVLTTVFDIWTALLIDEGVQDLISHMSVTSDKHIRSFVVDVSRQLFPCLFECLLNVYIFESILTNNDDEGEEDAAIEARSVEDVLVSICTIGRVCFIQNNTLLHNYLSNTMMEITQLYAAEQNGHAVNETIKLIALEKLRITLLFACYMLIDNFHENSEEMESEISPMSELIVDACYSNSTQTVATLYNTVNVVNQVLQFQMMILGTVNGACNYLLSPMLLQLIYRFMTEYVKRYLVTNFGDDRGSKHVIPQFNINSIYGNDYNAIIETFLSAVQHILIYLPLETELVVNISEYMTSLSTSQTAERLHHIVSSPHIATIAEILTNQYHLPGGVNIIVPCRLTVIGNCTIFEALSTLLITAKNETFFTQLCTSVYTQCSAIPSTSGHDAESALEKSLSSLNGLAKCPSGMDTILHSLFSSCFPILKTAVHQHSDNDVILKLYLSLLRDFAEVQLNRLNNTSCFELYKQCFDLLQLFAKRFTLKDLHVASMDEETVHFRNESCWGLLELLNHLSSKDFAFSDEYTEELNRSFEEEVSLVLLYGLQTMTPVISIDMLRAFPLTADRYFSFVAFITGTYVTNLVKWLNSLTNEEGKSRLVDIVQHLLWGCGSYEAATARQALQALQSIGVNQFKSLQNPQRFIGLSPVLHNEVLLLVLDRLLEIVLLPQGREHDLSWNRVDALGNTLITYIALDTQRFQHAGSSLVLRHSQQNIQQVLYEGLSKLSSGRGVVLNNIEKANRLLFVANFREFVTMVKSLNIK